MTTTERDRERPEAVQQREEEKLEQPKAVQKKSKQLRAARLRPAEFLRLGAAGLAGRPARVLLSTLGIALGIAAMLGLVGISASSRAELDRTLERLGTNLLTVAEGQSFDGKPGKLHPDAAAMIRRIGPVRTAAATGAVKTASIYRNDHIPSGQTMGIGVLAADDQLPKTIDIRVRRGAWFNRATAEFPTVVLGSRAAELLDIRFAGTRVWLGGKWFGVAGILAPVPLAPEIDESALVGWRSATRFLRFDGHPSRVYCRTAETQVEAVRRVLAQTASPENASITRVSRPSDALAAKRVTNDALDRLLIALGGVALLVGGVGIANTMVISVLERRSEIGLRRALGATRGQIRGQFLAESLVLSLLGGSGGVVLGIAVTGAYAASQGWPSVVPAAATAGALGATLVIGALAGLYPAIRAARVSPTEALASP